VGAKPEAAQREGGVKRFDPANRHPIKTKLQETRGTIKQVARDHRGEGRKRRTDNGERNDQGKEQVKCAQIRVVTGEIHACQGFLKGTLGKGRAQGFEK